MNIEKIVNKMEEPYGKDEIFPSKIEFNAEENNLIKKYKDNIMIYFLIPNLPPNQSKAYSCHYGRWYYLIKNEQDEQIALCKNAKIPYTTLQGYTPYNITETKVYDMNAATFLVDSIDNKIIWGWKRIVNYTDLIWDKTYQKYNVLPKMKRMKK